MSCPCEQCQTYHHWSIPIPTEQQNNEQEEFPTDEEAGKCSVEATDTGNSPRGPQLAMLNTQGMIDEEIIYMDSERYSI